MQYTPVSRRKPGETGEERVYARLDDLMRLRFKSSGFSFLPRQPVHSVLSGRHASRLRGRGLNFEELRDYLPGDDTRNIDWKVTARTGEPHVRVYTEEKDRAVWLLIDQRLSMFFGSRWKMKSVVAAEAAAIAAWRALSQGDRVGAVVFDDTDMRLFAPHRSAERIAHILGCVVEKNHALNARPDFEPAPHMLNRAIQRVAAEARHDCLVVLITDTAGLDDKSRRHVTALTEHNDVIAVFIYDPLEEAMPRAGRLVFSDGERQVEFDSNERQLRERFAENFQQRMERMRDTSRRHEIPLLRVNTATPVEDQLREALGRRARP
jgi:uncharacterized protein (DUF58 family)